MKITTLILLMALMQVSAASVAQRITFVKKNASLEQVFQEITRQTGYEVFYGDKKFDDSRKINVAFKDATLDEVLKTCLQYQRASYVIEEKSIIIKPAAEPSFLERVVSRWAAIDVHGRVVDQEGKPLPGATVKIKATGRTISTDVNGQFELKGIDEGTVLVISFIGYVNKEVTAEKEIGNIVLELSDVQVLTGKGKTAAHRLIMAIKKSLDKQKYLPLTVQEFCEYTGLSLDIVVERLK